MNTFDQAIPEGYKQTEVGIIPKDWVICTIDELAAIIDPQPDHRTPPESSTGEPYIGISDFINNKEVDWASSRKVISKTVDKQEKSFQIKNGDIVFGKIGTIGVPKFVPQVPFRFALSANVILLQPKKVEPVYLMEFFYSELFQQTLKAELHSTSQAAFGMNKMRLIKVPLAPKEEQIAIANALSDVDALLTELEKLIAKKQAIKTATMQQLLTGKTRLPQFATYAVGEKQGQPKGTKPSELGEIPDDWNVKSVGEFTDCSAGGTPSTQVSAYWGGSNPWMSSGELHLKRVYDVAERITDLGLANSSTKFIPKNSVLMGLAGQGKTRGTVAISKIKLCTNQSIATIFPSKMHSTDYLFYNLDNRYKELRSLSTGDGGRGGLNLSIIRNLKLPFPDLEEQTAIATILSDMDSEIQALEQRLAKTHQIKQGMMQELLTGRTRLPFKKES